MLRRLIWNVCELPARCRDALLDRWYGFDRGLLPILLVPVMLIGIIASFVRFAYLEHAALRAEQHRQAELHCLAENIYYEGRGEPEAGQRAIAEVTLNRVAAPRFPDTVCGVVHERHLDHLRGRYVGAFSWTELELRRPAGSAWSRAMTVAEQTYDAPAPTIVPDALFYHASHVRPRWARQKHQVATIGAHVFYR